jgi:formamidopyrimidine-DNA glycosylase
MSLQMLILRQPSPDIYHFLAEYCNFQKNIGPISDSMSVAKNNVAGVGNNYLKDHQFLCKMSPDEIVGISAYMAEKA